jgi:hypothetical protein
LLLGEWLIVAIPLSPPNSWADGIGIGFAVLVIGAWLAKRPALASNPNVSRWAWLAYSLPTGLYWMYYLRAFWPGIISQDSVVQWNQMTGVGYADYHPAAHTMSNWLITRMWNSPAAIVLVQIALLSLVIGLGLAWMRRRGMPRWLAIAASCLLAFSPADALLAITLWKDVLYSTACLALTVVVLACVQTDGQWLTRRLSWLWLAIPAIIVYLFRHNGFPVPIAVLAILLLVFRRQWRPLLISIAVCAGCIAIVKGPVFRMANVYPVQEWLKSAPVLHYLAAHVNAKTSLLPEERAVLDQIIPPKDGYEWPYNPVSVDSTLNAKGFSPEAVVEHSSELKRILISLTLRRPDVTFEHIKNSSRLVWQIQWSTVIPAAVRFNAEHQLLRYDPALLEMPFADAPFVYTPLERPSPPGIEASFSPICDWFAWRPALLMYLFFAGCIVASIRSRNAKYLLVALPIFVQEGIMSLVGVSPDFRYHWGTYLAGILMSGYLLFAIPRKDEKPT